VRRRASAALITCAALVLLARGSDAKGLGDCDKKVPADAERVFQTVAAAFRKADAAGVTAAMPANREARLTLQLVGLDSNSYAREQATAVLSDKYFPDHKILSLMPADGCTTGDDALLSRTYRMSVQVAGKERSGTLIIELQKKKIDETTSAWFLCGLKES
jgi:hypothetical protein